MRFERFIGHLQIISREFCVVSRVLLGFVGSLYGSFFPVQNLLTWVDRVLLCSWQDVLNGLSGIYSSFLGCSVWFFFCLFFFRFLWCC